MLITKFSYLNVFDNIQNFYLLRDTAVYLNHNTGTNYTYQNMAVVIYSRITIQNMMFITSLYNIPTVMMLGIPRHQEGVCELKLTQSHFFFQCSFGFCSVFILCWAEPCMAHTLTPYCSG